MRLVLDLIRSLFTLGPHFMDLLKSFDHVQRSSRIYLLYGAGYENILRQMQALQLGILSQYLRILYAQKPMVPIDVLPPPRPRFLFAAFLGQIVYCSFGDFNLTETGEELWGFSEDIAIVGNFWTFPGFWKSLPIRWEFRASNVPVTRHHIWVHKMQYLQSYPALQVSVKRIAI